MTPTITILIVLGSLINLEMIHLAIIIGLLGGLGGVTIIIKSQALTIKVRTYIEAARVAGGGHGHIIIRHIIPNLLPLSFLYMMFSVTTAIAIEAVLSFFGLLNIRMSWG
jgi:peptide/nickel transport system permease protein